MPKGERPAVGDLEAAVGDPVIMGTSPGARCSSVRHEAHLVQSAALVQ